jgi:UPF0755 protein
MAMVSGKGTVAMRIALKKIALLAVAAVVLVTLFAVWQIQQFLTSPIGRGKAPLVAEIQAGSSAAKVAQQLHAAGLLDAPRSYVWYLRYQGLHGQLKTGELLIDPQWTVAELTEALIKGETVKYPATIVAGHTFAQLLSQLQALPKIKSVLSLQKLEEIYAKLNLPQPQQQTYPFAGLEGWFLPETYLYQAGDSDLDVLKRALSAMQKELEQAWAERAAGLPYKTAYDALIMASLVEKETGVAAERPLIAGVFINRLQKGMRLQTDPAVIYGIGSGYDGNIRKRDLLKTTPYNTYRVSGLPPTPIAMLSREALLAALHPQNTKALYFVATGNGEHVFSETLEAHNRAVRQYQLKR